MTLRKRLTDGLHEQARLGRQLGSVADAMASEVEAQLREADERVREAERESKEARAFRARFVFEAEHHLESHESINRDDLARLLARTGNAKPDPTGQDD